VPHILERQFLAVARAAAAWPPRSSAIQGPKPQHDAVYCSGKIQVNCPVSYRLKVPFALLATFVVLFGIHLVGSFVAWSLAPGNVVPRAGQMYTLAQRVAWPIFSFPLFYVLPAGVATTSFEWVLVMNSLAVALAIAIIAMLCVRFLFSNAITKNAL